MEQSFGERLSPSGFGHVNLRVVKRYPERNLQQAFGDRGSEAGSVDQAVA